MSVSPRLENYLCQAHIDYDVVHHGFTDNAYDSACSASVPTSNVVKAVILRDRTDNKYVVAAIPATHKVSLPWINKELNRDLILANEDELKGLFPDCLPGAIPGLGQAYDIDMIWDDQLQAQRDLYFEAGNHEDLVHISREQFALLFKQQPHSVISLPSEQYSLYHTDEIRGGLS